MRSLSAEPNAPVAAVAPVDATDEAGGPAEAGRGGSGEREPP